MAWYKERCFDEIVVMSTSIEMNPSHKMRKIAYTSKSHTTDFNDTMSSDKYRCDVQLTESKSRTVLSVVFMNDVHSFPLYSEAWKYPKEESRRAMKAYNRCVNLVEDLKVEYEYDEMPGPVLQAMARDAFRKIDKDRKHITPSRFLEAEKDLQIETDWRSTIYGNRLPNQYNHPLTPPIVYFGEEKISQKKEG